jgi:hypothetical protein
MNMQTTGKKGVVTVMVGLAMLTGVVVGNNLKVDNANAATTATPTTTQSTAQNQQPKQGKQFDPSKGGHMANGKTEQLLTGDSAEKVKAAAINAVPGGTIERVETDAEGDAYEAHMTKSDGSRVTVKFDSNFNVTKTEAGPNGRGQ